MGDEEFDEWYRTEDIAKLDPVAAGPDGWHQGLPTEMEILGLSGLLSIMFGDQEALQGVAQHHVFLLELFQYKNRSPKAFMLVYIL